MVGCIDEPILCAHRTTCLVCRVAYACFADNDYSWAFIGRWIAVDLYVHVYSRHGSTTGSIGVRWGSDRDRYTGAHMAMQKADHPSLSYVQASFGAAGFASPHLYSDSPTGLACIRGAVRHGSSSRRLFPTLTTAPHSYPQHSMVSWFWQCR